MSSSSLLSLLVHIQLPHLLFQVYDEGLQGGDNDLEDALLKRFFHSMREEEQEVEQEKLDLLLSYVTRARQSLEEQESGQIMVNSVVVWPSLVEEKQTQH